MGAQPLESVNDSNWSGTDLAVANGGTGSSTASAARSALGVAIGSNVQAWDADLDTYAANPLAATELAELQNIGSTTISATQWGYLGAMGAQPYESGDNATFGHLTGQLEQSSETSGTLTSASANKIVQPTGTVTIPHGVFSEDDVIYFVNPGGTSRTLQDNGTSQLYNGGADSASVSLDGYGLATATFLSGTVFIVEGNVS